MTTQTPTDPLDFTFAIGAPDVCGALSVFPVFGRRARLDYRSFAEASTAGVTIRERKDGPSVNDVVVHNPLDVAVLLYEGEEVRGAQQDRTLDVSVLVPAGTELPIPVTCVEHGRWDGSRRNEAFTPGPQAAFPALRRAKSRAAAVHPEGRAEQGEVWDMVAAHSVHHGARSGTGAMRDVFEARRDDVQRIQEAIPRHDEQLGMVAVIGSKVCVADLVGRADVFAALHAPLVAGYALDAAAFGDRVDTGGARAPGLGVVQEFLGSAVLSPGRARAGVGLGTSYRFASTWAQGARLEHEGELVALTAFPVERRTARVGRPSTRRM